MNHSLHIALRTLYRSFFVFFFFFFHIQLLSECPKFLRRVIWVRAGSRTSESRAPSRCPRCATRHRVYDIYVHALLYLRFYIAQNQRVYLFIFSHIYPFVTWNSVHLFESRHSLFTRSTKFRRYILVEGTEFFSLQYTISGKIFICDLETKIARSNHIRSYK